MSNERIKLASIALATLLTLSIMTVGGAMALSETNVGNAEMPLNDTFVVDNDTQALEVSATNVTNDTLDVTVYGIDSNGNQTQVANGTVVTDEANGTYTDTYSFTNINTSKYGEYNVSVAGDGAEEIMIYKLQKVDSGSGTGYLGSSTVLTISGVDLSGLELGVLVALLAVLIGWGYSRVM